MTNLRLNKDTLPALLSGLPSPSEPKRPGEADRDGGWRSGEICGDRIVFGRWNSSCDSRGILLIYYHIFNYFISVSWQS